MNRLGTSACPRCREPVLWLPTTAGVVAFDPDEQRTDDVPPELRFVITPTATLDEDTFPDRFTSTCLKMHRCSDSLVELPPDHSPLRWVEAQRRDFVEMSTVRTRAELIRAQALGRLRRHAGSHHHSPIDVSARLLVALRLDDQHCVLCRAELAGSDLAHIGTAQDAAATRLFVHLPECPRRRASDVGDETTPDPDPA